MCGVQSMMASRLMVISETQCTVLEVKVIEGLGTTIDVVLVNGLIHEGDTIVLCGMGGPIVTQIRSLLTPHPLKVSHPIQRLAGHGTLPCRQTGCQLLGREPLCAGLIVCCELTNRCQMP